MSATSSRVRSLKTKQRRSITNAGLCFGSCNGSMSGTPRANIIDAKRPLQLEIVTSVLSAVECVIAAAISHCTDYAVDLTHTLRPARIYKKSVG